jgi:hypothetical protein
MAATGLLGINPYFKGVNIDVSKPVNLAIQLEQKEAAKREALDKYFMDYEKSINPAGMRSQDEDIVLKKLNDNKQFYFQNRDKILNPSKYGAEYQSKYMAGFKDVLSDISKSKQASAEDKVTMGHYQKAKLAGMDIPDGFMDAVNNSQRPIYDKGYRPVNLYEWDFNSPFSTEKFQKDVFYGSEPDKKNIGSRTNKEGQIINIYKNEFDDDSLKVFKNRAKSQYRTNSSVTREVNKLIKTGEYKDLQPYYEMLNPKMSIENADPSDVAAAFALSLKQLGKTTESAPVFRPTTNINMGDQKGMEGLGWVKNIKKAIQGGELKDISAEGRKLFAGGGGELKLENMISRNLPNGVREIQIDYKDKLGFEGKEILRTDDPNIYYKLGGFYQKFTGSDVKMEKAVLGNNANLSNIDKPSKPKIETLAERMRRLANQKK